MPTYLFTLEASEAVANIVVERLTEGGSFTADAAGAFDSGAGRWGVEAYFPDDPGEDDLKAWLGDELADAGFERQEAAALVQGALLRPLGGADWSAIGLDSLPPVVAGRFRVFGEHNLPARLGRHDLRIEASTAFGTGDHASTYLSLVLLEKVLARRRASNVLDVGTGTGILGLAVMKAVPSARVLASDIEAHAVAMAELNRRLNEVGAGFTAVHAAGLDAALFRYSAPFDLILANILPDPLVGLAAPISRLAAPGADLIVAGLRIGEAKRLIAAYGTRGFGLATKVTAKEWAALHFVRTRSNTL